MTEGINGEEEIVACYLTEELGEKRPAENNSAEGGKMMAATRSDSATRRTQKMGLIRWFHELEENIAPPSRSPTQASTNPNLLAKTLIRIRFREILMVQFDSDPSFTLYCTRDLKPTDREESEPNS